MPHPHHIIAIGASAGGMEDLNAFFDHTPLDGVAYVIVQHLSPDFKSRMVELLARHSKLSIEEAQNGMPVKSNQVYLIPNDKYMTIHDGKLQLTGKENIKGPHLTINTFFNSLAADVGKKAIGIIMSGLGSDGTEGIKAIKKAGGMAIARDPETTEFGSMPSHTIATGLTDFILVPELMPNAIEDYVKYGDTLLAEHPDDQKNLSLIIELINEHLPLDFSDYKQTTILRRTKKRAAFGNFGSLSKYYTFLKSNPEEITALSNEYLISVTSFFRDPAPFEFIQKNILPGLLETLTPGEELKMWIAGCATGEEVYSMAILIAEQLTGKWADTIVKLFATDIDSTALGFAGRGVYPDTIAKHVSAERLSKYFIKENDNYRVSPSIRKMVIFAHHDLVKNPPYCNMHLISCRNLLIYMTPVLQKKIFNILLFGIKLNGYLFLGPSENPASIIKNLETVNTKWKIYKNVETKKGSSFDTFSLPEMLDSKHALPGFLRNDVVAPNNSLSESMYNNLADEMGCLIVCIDDYHHVIKSYGDTSQYLLNKHFSTNLTELLPKPLAVAFNTLSRSVRKINKKETLTGIKINLGQAVSSISVSISPLIEKKSNRQLWTVIFMQDQATAPVLEGNTQFDEKIHFDAYTLNLEEELQEMKEKLQNAYEKLDATNENLQSYNEELISANEEMQSTNEEMQSVNEELNTINADYQWKNKELVEINDDLNNYFRSNINGQVFINHQLQLMKFSPGTVKQINLLETDIGRPLSNISTNFKFETIIDDIKKVLAKGGVVTKEVETNDGRWYQAVTMPYIQLSDQKTTGAIITFNDITELKKTQQELNNTNQLLNMTIDSAEMGSWTIDIETLDFLPSQRLKEIFGFHPDEAMSYEAALAQIIPEQRALVAESVKAAIKQGKRYDVEYSLRGFHDGQLRWVRAIGKLTHGPKDQPVFFTGTLMDITLYKQNEQRKNDFIAMVSHELKTPLTSMSGYLQLIGRNAQKQSDEFTISHTTRALKQVGKMTTMINGFLNISRLEFGKIYIDNEVFDLSALLKETEEETIATINTHQVVFSPTDKIMINADRDKIGQVMNNLISNAVKYSPQGTSIQVSCEKIDSNAVISVKDEGMGVPQEDLGKLFDRFYRVERSETTSIGGFGIGLYLCSEIIKRHQGTIWVESELGKGSTFSFSLPVL
jgi:two-component system, chemotaxis family, CheB/CheR fusion protein